MSLTVIFFFGLAVSTMCLGGLVFTILEVRRLSGMGAVAAESDASPQGGR